MKFTATGITFTNLVPDPFPTSRFAGFIFDILSGPAIGSVSIDQPASSSVLLPFVSASSTANQIQVNFSGACPVNGSRAVTCASGEQVVLNVAAVPEPATWAMMIGGFGMIGGTMRRRRSAIAHA